MTVWVLIYWLNSLVPNIGYPFLQPGYYISESACIENGEKFKQNQKDRNYICIEAEVKE